MTAVLVGYGQHYQGVAADAKPTAGVPTGSIFDELDTGKRYTYDGAAWQAVSVVAGGTRAAFADHSGTCDGAAHPVLAANPLRSYLEFQNPTTQSSSFWVSYTTTAVQDSPSIEIAPGVTRTFEGSAIPTNAISLIGPNGVKYTLVDG